jgi:NAD(P)-dependent dehydrogenase (short-subunit alcohol dehydrogenase family)
MTGVLLVTGASGGIGAATALAGACADYAVAVHYSTRADAAEAVCASIRAMGGRAVAFGCDMADETAIVDLFAAIDDTLGPVNALVNNAGGVFGTIPFADLNGDSIARTLAVNLAGPMLCCREAVRRMSKARGGQGGAIVNISSMASVLGGLPHEVHYAASKGGVDSLTIGLAREVADQGIRVNAIRPGVIATPILSRLEEGMTQRLVATVPMRRAGLPQEVAAAALWLLSDAASYVTGSILNVSGGR